MHSECTQRREQGEVGTCWEAAGASQGYLLVKEHCRRRERRGWWTNERYFGCRTNNVLRVNRDEDKKENYQR